MGIALFALLVAGGCAGIPREGPSVLSPSTSSFQRARDEATRRAEVYVGLDRRADLRATLLTPRVREAFLRERDRFHGAFAAEAEREWIAMGSADEGVDAPMRPGPVGEHEILVFVAFYSSDPRERSLATRTSIWDVHLVRDGRRLRPATVESIRLSPAVVDVFPYVDRFDDLYLLRFPVVDAATGAAPLTAGMLALEVRSAEADCVVDWLLRD